MRVAAQFIESRREVCAKQCSRVNKSRAHVQSHDPLERKARRCLDVCSSVETPCADMDSCDSVFSTIKQP